MNRRRLLPGLVCEFRSVDDGMGDFLPRDINGFIGTGSISERARLAEDAQPHVTHRQPGDDVRLLHGSAPDALVDGWGRRFRGRSGLRLENIHRAVEPGLFVRPALLPGRVSAINCLYWGRERMICYGDCGRRRDRLHLEDLFVA